MARVRLGAWIGSCLLLLAAVGCKQQTAHDGWVEPSKAQGGREVAAYDDSELPPGARLVFRFLNAASGIDEKPQTNAAPAAASPIIPSTPAVTVK